MSGQLINKATNERTPIKGYLRIRTEAAGKEWIAWRALDGEALMDSPSRVSVTPGTARDRTLLRAPYASSHGRIIELP